MAGLLGKRDKDRIGTRRRARSSGAFPSERAVAALGKWRFQRVMSMTANVNGAAAASREIQVSLVSGVPGLLARMMARCW
jgi:hypothetical protein